MNSKELMKATLREGTLTIDFVYIEERDVVYARFSIGGKPAFIIELPDEAIDVMAAGVTDERVSEFGKFTKIYQNTEMV